MAVFLAVGSVLGGYRWKPLRVLFIREAVVLVLMLSLVFLRSAPTRSAEMDSASTSRRNKKIHTAPLPPHFRPLSDGMKLCRSKE